jgi:predicted kinase
MIDAACPFLAELEGCAQDPVHHAEGDVLVHTRMVGEAMAKSPTWRALPAAERELLFLAALCHDCGKPATTRTDVDGRITSRGHSRRGELLSRRRLYLAAAAPSLREAVAGLVRSHQVPFFAVDREDGRSVILRTSLVTRADHLAILAEADARGRICADVGRMLDNVALFVELAREQGCLSGPFAFPSDHSRFLYFRKPHRDPGHLAHDDTRSELTLLSGLPGAGKDTWARTHAAALPAVSLDGVRAELGVAPEDGQRTVIARAEEMAREHLRAARSFVLNATNLSRDLRDGWVNLGAAYGARIRIVHVEAPWATVLERNRARGEAQVPVRVLNGLLDRWQLPDLTEAQRVDLVVSEG